MRFSERNSRKKSIKNVVDTRQNGITLIALVITIIVLLILAGISIMMLAGNNGILNKASDAKIQMAIAEKKEEVSLAITEDLTNNLGDSEKVTISSVVNIIKKNYSKDKEKEAISGETVREDNETDKFAGIIIYESPASGIGKTIIITVDDNFNVSGYTEDSSTSGIGTSTTYDVPESTYTKTGNIYYYSPDLSGFNPEATYYVTYDENGNNEQIYGRIDKVETAPSGWHDYANKIWGNVVTVTGNNVTYWTWIPRYKYSLDSANVTSNVSFVDLNNKCKIATDSGDEEKDVSSYILPESFEFGGSNLKGYWVSKYEVQFSEATGIEQLRVSVDGTTLNVTTTNPSGTYTIFVNGTKVAENQSLSTAYQIKGLQTSRAYDICVYSETNGRMVGRKKSLTDSNISVDTSGFDKSSTYYVVYDKDGNESIAGRLDNTEVPRNWYDYENKIWANLVTVTENNVTYWTYIPRYEYDITGVYTSIQLSDVHFISKSQTEASYGYQIPESFTFNGEELAGYWVSKYEIQFSENSGLEQIQLIATSSDITVTTSNPSGTYTIYVDGKVSKTGVTLPYTIKDLNEDTEYDICLYSETNNRMVGSNKKSTDSISKIEVDLSGFNPECTYYVTYDSTGENETIGDKIKLDSNGNATNIPKDWYNYPNKIWANVVTKGKDSNGNELITYWTYIPRYEYDVSGLYNSIKMSDVRFISVSQTTADFGYTIPECFSFGGKELKGIWVSKYEVQGTID